MDNIKWSYTAGLFDGEGTFTISSLKRNELPDYVFAEIYITNTNQEVMSWLKDNFGGSIRLSRRLGKNWKDCYKWFLPAKRRKEFITKILPYLIIKKNQAKLLLELFTLMENQKASLRGKNGLTLEESKLRQDILVKVKSYNKRGVKNITLND